MLAAADAFAERGFHATTTRDIASRAGLSPAGVYVHFASKEVLLFELSRRGHARARDLLVAAADGPDPDRGAAGDRRRVLRWHAEHYELGRIVQFEFRHLSPEHREAVLGLRKEIDGVVAGVLRAASPPVSSRSTTSRSPRWPCCRWPSTSPGGTPPTCGAPRPTSRRPTATSPCASCAPPRDPPLRRASPPEHLIAAHPAVTLARPRRPIGRGAPARDEQPRGADGRQDRRAWTAGPTRRRTPTARRMPSRPSPRRRTHRRPHWATN